MAKADLTAQRLRELLDYDSTTGSLMWLGKRRGAQKDKPAGTIGSTGYRSIRIDGVIYSAHRLAWLHATGMWPAGIVDHINGNRSDNSLENLRDVSQAINRQNLKKANSDNKSGFLGVTRDHARGKWFAIIYVDKRKHNLGRFATPEEAHASYIEATRRLHPGCTI